MGLDKDRVLAWLDERTAAVGFISSVVYQGLAERIRRGDFDEKADD